MPHEFIILLTTAASIGFIHTLLGPDHYLPFIVMAKAGKWSHSKTLVVTFLCGIGHVAGSVVFGLVGISLGIALQKIEFFESFRGNLAAWALIAFGFVYFIWGIKQSIKNKPHSHLHVHSDGSYHVHKHGHAKEHAHVHTGSKKSLTPWVLFTIFVLGPCEPLIPILMYPAAKNSLLQVFLVSAMFGVVTIATMMTVVYISFFGLRFLPERKLERYIHAIAGGTILLSGLAIQFLGL
jgi:nickel/cobalt transporter (NicO) family protein